MDKLPLLPIRDPELVLFPNLPSEIEVGRDFSVNAINKAIKNDYRILFALQTDHLVDKPEKENLYEFCIEAEIKNKLSLNPEKTKFRIISIGLHRCLLKELKKEDDCFWGEFERIVEPEVEITDEIKNSVNEIKNIINTSAQYIVIENNFTPKNSKELSMFIDCVAGQIPVVASVKREFLSEIDIIKRLDNVLKTLVEVSNNTELGVEQLGSNEVDERSGSELKELERKIEEAGMPDEALKVAKAELRKLSMMTPHNAEFQVSFNYLENLVSLPWNVETEDEIDIEKARDILDEEHYGLEKPKSRILEFLAIRKLKPENSGSILCFAGPSGVGKTSNGKSIAKAMGRKYIRLSLGGVGDEAEIRGHRRTYIGAMPGRIMEKIKKVGTKNPVFVLDEVDKLCSNFRGDPSSALLEVLDPEQNFSFMDHYLGVPFDLSHVLFIITANEISKIPAALRDRLEIINIAGYSPYDKIKIAERHLIPKQFEANGLKEYKDKISFTTKAIESVIEQYTNEAGVRSLERECGSIIRKLAISVASGKTPKEVVDESSVSEFLGPPKIFTDRALDKPEVGLSTGLAWSRNGGSILFVETSITSGKGKINKPTGNLGKIIQESVNAAYTWIKANHEKYGVSLKKLNESDINIHFPSGAIPKDGPSAGVAITTSILSALTDKPVRNDVAMTGEISLRGRVLPIGGLKEKIMAAHRAGINNVILPEKNKHDLEDIPEDIASSMKFIKISNLEEALDILLTSDENKNNDEINVGTNEQLINKGL